METTSDLLKATQWLVSLGLFLDPWLPLYSLGILTKQLPYVV